MTLIHRNIESIVQQIADSFPVIYVNGPRQAGKTTLVKNILNKQFHAEFRTFDDFHERNAAQHNPEIFLKSANTPLIIDEVQMVSSLFRPLKLIIDERREAALIDHQKLNLQYILTGSANLLALPELASAMVGRMATLTLLPLSTAEVLNIDHNFIQLFFNDEIPNIKPSDIPLSSMISQATFPILKNLPSHHISEWFKNYLYKITIDDPKHLYNLEKAQMMPLLLQALAIRAGSLINDADLSRDIGLNTVTTRLYRHLLQDTFVSYFLKPWHKNIGKRLVKSPKVYFYDTLLLCHLLQSTPEDLSKFKPELFGHVLENFVLSELLKCNTLLQYPVDISFYRTHEGQEIDFILETPTKTVAIEIKNAEQIQAKDIKNLKEFKAHVGQNFHRGIILCNVKRVIPIEEDIFLVPISALWSSIAHS